MPLLTKTSNCKKSIAVKVNFKKMQKPTNPLSKLDLPAFFLEKRNLLKPKKQLKLYLKRTELNRQKEGKKG